MKNLFGSNLHLKKGKKWTKTVTKQENKKIGPPEKIYNFHLVSFNLMNFVVYYTQKKPLKDIFILFTI